jgi:hypothetical protein
MIARTSLSLSSDRTFVDEFSPLRELFLAISSKIGGKLPENEYLFPTLRRKRKLMTALLSILHAFRSSSHRQNLEAAPFEWMVLCLVGILFRSFPLTLPRISILFVTQPFLSDSLPPSISAISAREWLFGQNSHF